MKKKNNKIKDKTSKKNNRDKLEDEKEKDENSRNDNDYPFLDNNHNLTEIEYYEKNITKDGNYYYRCLSYYYRGTEDYHLEFRKLISEIFENNLEKFIESYPDPDIIGEKEPQNEEETIEYLKKYVNYMKKSGVYAGDQEIALTAYYFGININVLILDAMGYKSLYYYESVIPTNEVINILYKNGNHYQILFKRNNKNLDDKKEFIEEEKIEDYINKKKLEIINNNKKYLVESDKFVKPDKNIITSKYMNYNKPECINKYNEIYHYLRNNEQMPERLKYNDKAKYKTIRKKRTAFRKQVKEKYTIIDNRLKYKYLIKKYDEKLLNIPFFNEEKYIISNIHNHTHPGIRVSIK